LDISSCEGFRTPAPPVKVFGRRPSRTFPHARRPASENLQGMKPRGGARIWAVPCGQLWGFGRVRATAKVSSEGQLSGGDRVAGRGRRVLLICGPMCRRRAVRLLRGERGIGAS
jgi:hypothetical protein